MMFKTIAVTLFFSFLVLAVPSAVHAQSFTFGAAGDFANGTDFAATLVAIKQQNPTFFLALGDFSYTDGAELEWCNKWKASYTNVAYLTGNHDSGENPGGNITTYLSNCPPNPMAGTVGMYGHQFYFDYPTTNPIARFIMIRPGVLGNNTIDYTAGKPGYVFTQNAIDTARAQGIKWVIVGMHKNYITIQQKDNEVGTDLMTMLFSKKVDLILQGHEHGYQRTKQLSCANTNTFTSSCVADSDNSYVKGLGPVIDIIGTGGQGTRYMDTTDAEYPYFATVDNTTYGFGKFTVTASQLSYSFVRASGGTLSDSFTINGPLTSPSPTPSPSLLPSPTPTPTPRVTPSPTPTPSPSPSPTPTPVVCIGDINGDKVRNLSDYSIFLANFLKTPVTVPNSDLNKDGKVDLSDYSLFLNGFLKQCP